MLGRAEVGPNENFFEAGGTSLKAVQLVALIRKELNQRLSVVSVFECPTLALLSARLGPAAEDESRVPAALLRGQRRRQSAARSAGFLSMDMRKLDDVLDRSPVAAAANLTRVAVIGAGNIGTGVATDLVLHGIDAVVVDLSERDLAAGRRPRFCRTCALPRCCRSRCQS